MKTVLDPSTQVPVKKEEKVNMARGAISVGSSELIMEIAVIRIWGALAFSVLIPDFFRPDFSTEIKSTESAENSGWKK